LDTPSLGDLLDESRLDDIPAMDATSLQIANAEHVTFSLLLGNAIFGNKSAFGIYNINNPDQRLEIFTDKDMHGKADKHGHGKGNKHGHGKDNKHQRAKNIEVNFDISSDLAWIKPNKKVEIGDEFGFYFDSTTGNADHGEIFYSQTSLNSEIDDDVHTLLFGTSDIDDYLNLFVAFEDATSHCPEYVMNYNDMLVGINIDGFTPRK
jgi:hypothetical protein